MNTNNLLELVLDSKTSEYEELCDRWRDLDAKAQSLVTLAGVVLTGFLAFISNNLPTTLLGKVAFVAIVIVFACALITAAIALWIREVKEPPSYETIEAIVQDMRNLDETGRMEREDDLHGQLIGEWKDVNREVRNCVSRKVVWVQRSQVWTAIAVGLLVITATMKIFWR